MKKSLTLFLAALMLALGANAQLLWRVSGNGAKGDSFIFGTHHVAPVAVIDSVIGLTPAIKAVDTVYGEVVMPENPQQSPELIQLSMKYMMAPADSTLSAVLTKAQLDSLDTVLATFTGIPGMAAQLNAMKPAAVSAQLAMLQTMKAFPGFNPAEQLDTRILSLGREVGKTVKGLETMEEQFEVLFGPPIAEQAADLMDAVRDANEGSDNAVKLANAYRRGDLKAIEAILDEQPSLAQGNAVHKRLLEDRNNAWVNTLRQVLPNERVLVAVGTAHLVGDSGLINALRQAGFSVTPVE